MFRLLLFFPIILLSQEIYTLPDEADLLIYHYNKAIDQANFKLLIYSSNLQEPRLRASLKKAARKNIPVTLITPTPLQPSNQMSYLSLLENISLYILQSFTDEKTDTSLICVDDKEFYFISNTLERKKLKAKYAFAMHHKGRCVHLFYLLIKRSKRF